MSLLGRRGRIDSRSLALEIGVSAATLRRDLTSLERDGRLLRVHGGVMLPGAQAGESSHIERERVAAAAKRRVAELALGELGAARRVFIDAGTTCLEFARLALGRGDLTVYTHSVAVLGLAPRARARVVGLGGECRAVSLAMVGAVTLDWIGRLRFDACFLGATAVDADEGYFTTELSESGVKRAALGRAARRLVLADRGKLGAHSAVRFAQPGEIDCWIHE